ncbi:CBS domain-containing protein [Mariniphaga anaerophila]|uniref:CBS domain-containing protein n=1 Tax=Mariniphaga anaerophila TaxID=1484053 RepID=A0A1M5AGD3_9BACT|nr:CBS domain-containing protein [Mariniphaga anaerophila]SHF29186.1 CBS domain-containing protein [Mariniphaga anaerophila]
MLANSLISDVVPAVNSADKGQKVLSLMDVFRVSHLPVVDEGRYHGIVSDKFIYDLNLVNEPIGKEMEKFDTTHVHENQHIFEVAILMYKLKLSVVAVLDSMHEYLGSITLYDLARRFARYFSLQELGGVVVLVVNEIDYSLSQISQIVESNDTKILSFFMNRLPGTNTLELVLKLDKEDLSPVIQSFMRYDYNVKGVYLDHSMLNDLYQDRYDQFMKFMNI